MILLVAGLVVFLGLHSMKIAAPRLRARAIAQLGEQSWKAVYAAGSLLGLVLIIVGFSTASANPSVLYVPPLGLRPLAFVLLAVALVLAIASGMPGGWIKRAVRHPLLIATMLWAIAHLIVNGDAAGVILFGAFLAWAAFDLLAQPPAIRKPGVPSPARDLAAVGVGLVLYALFIWQLHFWLFGVRPVLF